MPLAGGAADKFGNRYEGRWTVWCMLDVMAERADSIRLEPPGPEGDGVEFPHSTPLNLGASNQLDRGEIFSHARGTGKTIIDF